MSKPIDIPVKVEVYDALTEWEVNAGQSNTIVPKKITGRYRTFKNIAMMVWLIYFLGPYLRWGDRQAVLLDISQQQFHIFDVTIFPQDVWVLSLTLLFFAILLAVVTSVAGRVFCGYFCFQTVWTEVFSFIEGKCEGDTAFKRSKFNNAPWSVTKLTRKAIKHVSWLLIAVLTGITFAAWFTDAYQLWPSILSLQAPTPVWVVMATFTFFTYWFAGFMREQVCFWLCPYARLQGVMYDQDTVLPAYDAERGEPRGKHAAKRGGCIDCNVCVAVCPTGVDIRKGQQEGCITCGLCIDACDSIMEKIKQPKGLIRYASHKELYQGLKSVPLFKRYRVALYGVILLVCLAGIIHGFMSFSATEFTVTPQRQPVYTLMSNGDIQNKYTLKILNKTKHPIHINYDIKASENYSVYGLGESYEIAPGKAISAFALVRLSATHIDYKTPLKLQFIARSVDTGEVVNHYDTLFFTP